MGAGYQEVVAKAREATESFLASVLKGLKAPVDGGMDFGTFEQDFQRDLHALGATITGLRLEQYDLPSEPYIEIGGETYRLKGHYPKEYHGLNGTFVVERALYVPCAGGHGIVPMEGLAGMVEGTWTPLLAKAMAQVVASTTPNEAADIFKVFGGHVPSTSSLDRLPKRLSAVWEDNRKEFEQELREFETVPASAASVVVSLDGILVPMRDAERATTRDDEDKRHQGPAGYREVGCGTISLYDEDGERIGTIRHARMPEPNKLFLKEQLEAELATILASRPDLTLVLLADGSPDNWSFLDKLAKRHRGAFKAEDIFHVLGHVKDAFDAYHGEGTPEAKAAFEEARINLRESSDGAERVIRALRYRRDRSKGAQRAVLARVLKYLCKRRKKLRYKEMLDRSLPIGSGVVEAACKTLAAQRLKRSGMSWLEEGGQAILTLRSLIQSNRWERGWSLLANAYRLNRGDIRVAA